MQRVALEFASRGGFAVLRGLCGHDEEAIGGTDTEAALGLLDRLLVDAPGVIIGPGHAAELAAPDRDRLLAAVFRAAFGPRVESTVPCAACQEPFDLDFVVLGLGVLGSNIGDFARHFFREIIHICLDNRMLGGQNERIRAVDGVDPRSEYADAILTKIGRTRDAVDDRTRKHHLAGRVYLKIDKRALAAAHPVALPFDDARGPGGLDLGHVVD